MSMREHHFQLGTDRLRMMCTHGQDAYPRIAPMTR
jgi:hypothetical protein